MYRKLLEHRRLIAALTETIGCRNLWPNLPIGCPNLICTRRSCVWPNLPNRLSKSDLH